MISLRMHLLIFLFLSFGATLAQGKNQNLNEFYQQVYLGERKTALYSGPISPEIKYNDMLGTLEFIDDLYREAYTSHYLPDEFFRLTNYWFNDITQVSSCPNHYINQNINYIRYLFRLQTMSYLFESMKETNLTLHALGFDRNSCPLSWHQTFSQCEPVNEDMKKFVERVKFRYLRDISQSDYVRLDKNAINRWQGDFKKEVREGKSKRVVGQRLIEWCAQQGLDCSKLSLEQIGAALEASCQFDRQMIKSICSEQDELYGLSYIDGMVDLLSKSNALGVINTGGYGVSCLKRYVSLFKAREFTHSYLVNLFDTIKQKLGESDARYLQGSLFLPGALKEFDLKGLDNFLFAASGPAPEPVEEVVAAEPIPEPVVIEAKVEPVPVVVVPESVPEPEPMPEPTKRSEFALAHEKLRNSGERRVLLNMAKFEADFIFTSQMKNALSEPLKDYQTREALLDMQKYDFLGTRVEPFRLIFLKFLIDHHMHQGLFNIIAVIGSQFYVINDIDGEGAPVAVEIANDVSTNNRWQLTLLRDDQVTNKKIMDDDNFRQ